MEATEQIEPVKSTIEGVGDEVVRVFWFMMVVVVTLGYLFSPEIVRIIGRRYRRRQNIHPENEAEINEFRRDEEQMERQRQSTRRRMDEAKNQTDHECPICLGVAHFALLTDCGHVFCCDCIIGYWQHTTSILKPVQCAICRTVIHMLLPLNWPSHINPTAQEDDENGVEDEREMTNEQLLENNIRINDYNRRFSTNRTILDYIRDIPVVIPYLCRNFFNNDLITIFYRIRIAVIAMSIVFYFLNPMDLMPESTMGAIGLMDDLLISLILFCYLVSWLRGVMARRGFANQADVNDDDIQLAQADN
ncbi:unnamed protein product [Caenorhabditis bovis]|uniref:E3 ubiquitin-protein ligase RNF170 n=1 Tax=Caenorhabditis bovis TaxID=2654633 RepID=A0A8S1EIV9_9PELO|nr:unnamed protein product [Caenorhabditis bovis]